MNKLEAASIRSQLRARISKDSRYEIYTTLHGSGIFRWFSVSKHDFDWYCQTFDLTIEQEEKEKETNHEQSEPIHAVST